VKNSISILLATYNGEKYLKEQLDSLFLQTYQEFDILIRDDCSKDSTVEIIKEYEKIYPKRIKLIVDEIGNLGSSKSFMKLLEYSNSDYIMFCDQDDIWLSNKIEISLNRIQELEKENRNQPLLVFSDLKVVNQDLKVLHKSFWEYQKLIPSISKEWKKLLAQNVITGCTMIINKKAKEVCLPFELPMMIHDQWIGVNISKYGKIDYLDEKTILYRQHENNVAGAHNYGLQYIASKLMKIKYVFTYFKKASEHFKEIGFLELVLYKMIVNINRFFRK